MAAAQCSDCGTAFDDEAQRTYCPHPAFEMRTLVIRDDGRERVCATTQEEDAFLAGEISDGMTN